MCGSSLDDRPYAVDGTAADWQQGQKARYNPRQISISSYCHASIKRCNQRPHQLLFTCNWWRRLSGTDTSRSAHNKSVSVASSWSLQIRLTGVVPWHGWLACLRLALTQNVDYGILMFPDSLQTVTLSVWLPCQASGWRWRRYENPLSFHTLVSLGHVT